MPNPKNDNQRRIDEGRELPQTGSSVKIPKVNPPKKENANTSTPTSKK